MGLSSSFKLALGLALLLALAGGFFYVKHSEKIACENKQKTVIIEAEGSRNAIENRNRNLQEKNIIDSLRTGDGDVSWLRSSE